MSTRVELSKIVEAMDMQGMEGVCCFDKDSGEIIVVGEEELGAAEDGDPLDDYPQWQQENIRIAKEIISDIIDKRFLDLPTKFDINEYRVMEEFSLSVQDKETSEALCFAIKGSGAFRRFKDCIHRFGIADEWYRYRDKALKEVAVEWCEENDIAYVDDLKDRGLTFAAGTGED